jgi:hypothetical protein
MGRINDEGPYDVDNIEIISAPIISDRPWTTITATEITDDIGPTIATLQAAGKRPCGPSQRASTGKAFRHRPARVTGPRCR